MPDWLAVVFNVCKATLGLFDKDKIGTFLTAVVGRTKIFIAAILVLLMATIGLISWYLKRTATYSNIVAATIDSSLEETPQTYKGLEAFLLSGVDDKAKNLLENAPISKDFLEKYEKLAHDVDKAQNLLNLNDRRWPDWDQGLIGTQPKPLEPVLKFAGEQSQDLLTDQGADGFLFLPLNLIRSNFKTKTQKINRNGDAPQITQELFKKDTQVFNDVILSRALASDISDLVGIQFVELGANSADLKPNAAQVYLITGSGVNRIFSNAMQDQVSAEDYYSNQFSASTYFPARPYYRRALQLFWRPLTKTEGNTVTQQPETKMHVGEYFYVSKPYLDLGGNGMVITVARQLQGYKFTPAVLCMDFTFQDMKNLTTTLSTTITQLNAKNVEATFVIGPKGGIDPEKTTTTPPKTSLNNAQSRLIQDAATFIQTNRTDLASMLGNIQRVDRPSPSQSDSQLAASQFASATPEPSAIEVSVPLNSRQEMPNATPKAAFKTATFLLFSLDLQEYRRLTDLIGVSALICATTLVGLLITAAVVSSNKAVISSSNNDLLKRATDELQLAFDRVGRIMEHAPTPYVFLSADDRITNTNLGMARLLETTESELIGQTFRELIDSGYRRAYDRIQADRMSGKTVRPYRLRFVKSDKSRTGELWISSAAVPTYDEGANAGFPETFGIFLEKEPPEQEE